MDQFVISIGAKICEYTVAPVAHELGYCCHYKTNVANLQTQIQHLEAAQVRMEHSVDEATRNGEEIEADVQNWLIRVTNITKDAEDFFEHEDHANPMCSCKFFQMLVSRHKLSKKAETMARDVDAEIKLATTILFQKVSRAVPPKGVIETEGYMTFHSRDSIFKEIMDALRNPNVRMIGVCGMGGVGKTMFAKELARQAKEKKLFDMTVMVTVSQTPDVKKIQKEIAENLDLKLDKETISVRAERLCRRLGQETKILLVLDDVWEKLELHEIGITFGNDRNQCKILLTSRVQDVIQNDMGAEKIFLLRELYDNEAKGLFGKIVGDSIMNNPDFHPSATEIVKECAGLPIAIETVANALKNKSYHVWNNALQELRSCAPTNIRGMHAKVYSSIKLSYNYLQSEEAKLMLLFIGLYPEDHRIDFSTFLICGIGLGLFQRIKELEEANNKVVTLVENLKASCLLLVGAPNYCFWHVGSLTRIVTMHDVIHDVVISIGFQEKKMFNLRNYVPEQEDNKQLKDATAISLLYSTEGSQLPERLECPQLKFLLVLSTDQSLWKDRYSQISDHFFEETKDLRVLELFTVCLTILPTSFRFLQNLQSLRLYKCDLGDVAWIGELKSLKILLIDDSNIVELPKQIGQLTRLQLLSVTHCSELEVIERNVISSLIHLEELVLTESFTKWDTDGVNSDRRNANLIELKNLSRLSSLKIHIPDVNIVPKGLFSMQLMRYQISIGRLSKLHSYSFNEMTSKSNCSRILGLDQLDLRRRLWNDPGLEMLLKKSEALSLYRSKGVNNLVPELDREGFPQLKCLHINKNDEMEYIINSMEQNHPCSAFLSLEVLYLKKLMNLEKICNGKLSTYSFGKLRVVKVRKCYRLKSLFAFSIAKQLEEIEVFECKMLTEIVTCLRENDAFIIPTEAIAKYEFPQLQSLKLESLHELVHFFHDESEATFTSQREDQGPISLFNTMVAFPSLKNLRLSALDSKMLWPDQLPETFKMQNLTMLGVDGCNSLKHVLSFAMARSLVQLRDLEVRQCSVMEEVLAVNDIRDLEGMDEKLLPNLKSLSLKDLPNLKSFCSKNCLKFLPFVNLESLVLEKLVNLEKLCHGKLTDKCFGKLRKIDVSNCNRLKSLFSLSEARILSKLKEITVAECNMMEEIVIHEIEDDDNQNISNKVANKIIEFPELCSLKLKSLPKFVQVFTEMKTNSREEELVANFSVPLFNKKVAFPSLKDLTLSTLNSQMLWPDQLPETLNMQSLTILTVNDCNSLKHLSSFAMVRNLVQLERLEVCQCSVMEDLIAINDISDLEGMDEKLLPNLKSLSLKDLPNLKSVYSKNCLKFLPFVNLESLVLEKLVNLEKLCHGKLTDKCFGKLRQIDVSNCNRLKSLFSLSEARILSKLKEIRVAECNMMEEIVIHEIEDDDNQNISNKVANKIIEFPELCSLKLEKLVNLEKLCHGKLTDKCFGKLRKIDVSNCNRLKSLFSLSEARILSKLKEIRVAECNMMEEIVIHEIEDDDNQNISNKVANKIIEFPELCSLKLEKLVNLEKLCHGKLTDKCFGKLRKIDVSNCNRLKSLFSLSEARILSKLKEIRVAECNMMEEIVIHEIEDDDNQNISNKVANKIIEFPELCSLKLKSLPKFVQVFTEMKTNSREEELVANFSVPLFNKKVAFPSLKDLTLSTLNSQMLWHDQLPETLNMRSLTILTVNDCNSLKHLSSFAMVRNLVQLERLEVCQCSVMEDLIAINDISDLEGMDEKLLPNLKSLSLKDLPNLKSFCSKNCLKFLPFVNLESLVLEKLVNLEKLCHGKLTDKCFGQLRGIDVSNCNRLKSLFSLSEARILSKLQEIRVAECNMMEEIVIHEIEDDDNQNISNKVANKIIEFPELCSLKLKSLPKFVQVFTEMETNGTCQGSREEELVATFPIPFFNEKVKFPKLKALTLEGIATRNTIWNCQFEGQLGDDKEHAGILSRLEGLKLRELPQLMHLWEEEDYHPVGRAFHNLKGLIVSRCDRLKNLVPCSISFQNLRYLIVSKCHGMENLLTPSTAKSLTQLRVMSITECRRMIQIVGDHQKGSNESESEIVFSRLEVLELDNLPSLTSFYSGNNHILRFPNLEAVFVKSCCQMQSFCNGQVSTPKLKKLILSTMSEEEDGYDSDKQSVDWYDDYEGEDEELDIDDDYSDRLMMELKEGDINATIKQLSESSPVDTYSKGRVEPCS